MEYSQITHHALFRNRHFQMQIVKNYSNNETISPGPALYADPGERTVFEEP